MPPNNLNYRGIWKIFKVNWRFLEKNILRKPAVHFRLAQYHDLNNLGLTPMPLIEILDKI